MAISVGHLDVDPPHGIVGSATSGVTPRQVCIAFSESLRVNDVKPDGARADIIIDGNVDTVVSGAVLHIGAARLRITFTCESCGHGARLADVPLGRFRRIRRSLAVVENPGRVDEGGPVIVESAIYPSVPETFTERTLWALDRMPTGRVVTSVEFLTAIGAGRSYSRVLPRWLRYADANGRPVWRVLTTSLSTPSWAPNSAAQLAKEGLTASGYQQNRHDLTRALWFQPADRGDDLLNEHNE